MMLRFALYALLLLFPIAARADYASTLAATPQQIIDTLMDADKQLIASPDYIKFIKTDLAQREAGSGRVSCDDFTVGTRDKFFLVDPAGRFFPPAPAPLAGPPQRWYERWNVTVCGKPGLRSFVVEQTPAGLHITPGLPGNSHADPALELETLRRGADVFRNNVCRQNVAILNTRVLDDSEFARHHWLEAWTVRRCGNDDVIRYVEYSAGSGPNSTLIHVGETLGR